jgi:sigma-B regulation protein RsbU (phosphoserine phosphatase)
MAMLPKTFPAFPHRDEIEIYGMLTPAKSVGGDLYDFFLRDDELFFCIGDVSGKGVPASLVMAVTRTLFRNVVARVESPHQIVETMNAALCDGNDSNMFVTLFVGALHLRTGHLLYCNAGHDAPYILKEKGKVESGQSAAAALLACDSKLPIGIMSDGQYTEQEADMTSGDMLFLYTDGLTEAENSSHELFGEDRITDVIAAFDGSPQELIASMTGVVRQFVGDYEQSDDLTMLAIQYKK